MPNHMVDYTGETHGYLTVIRPIGSRGGKMHWLVQCRCGNFKEIASVNIGRTMSCGCLKRSALGVQNTLRTKTGQRSAGPEYRSWKAMLERCRNPKAPNFALYGGRGITIYDGWLSKDGFANFYEYLGRRPVGTSLDRINTDGNYEPGNVRWATLKEQAQNRRDTPEYAASRKASLDAGRKRMWADPEIRARLVEDRRQRRRQTTQPKGP